MSAHTPGPWRWLDEATLVADRGARPVVLTPLRRGLPGMGTRAESGLIEPLTPEHPNSRLIAAAPDLLEVARELLEDHRRVDPHHEDMCALCRRAAAAIAKAQGAP